MIHKILDWLVSAARLEFNLGTDLWSTAGAFTVTKVCFELPVDVVFVDLVLFYTPSWGTMIQHGDRREDICRAYLPVPVCRAANPAPSAADHCTAIGTTVWKKCLVSSPPSIVIVISANGFTINECRTCSAFVCQHSLFCSAWDCFSVRTNVRCFTLQSRGVQAAFKRHSRSAHSVFIHYILNSFCFHCSDANNCN